MAKFEMAIAVEDKGNVQLEFWAADKIDDVVLKLTPEMALEAAEVLVRAARQAMRVAKKEKAS
jgi:enhancing lycopene biosynthesis protein 2